MKKIVSLVIMAALLLSLSAVAWAANEPQLQLAEVAPSGLACLDGTIYIADSYNRAIWAFEDGEKQLLAGRTDTKDKYGKPLAGYNDGDAEDAAFKTPWGILPYLDGLLISDRDNHVLRYLNLEENTVETLSGNGNAAYSNGSVGYVAYNSPTGLAAGDDGLVYIADSGNHVIRAMDEDGYVTSYVGSAKGCSLGELRKAELNSPMGLCYKDGVLYIADTGNHRILAVKDDELVLIAGGELEGDAAIEGGYKDGDAAQALFSRPQDIAVLDDGSIYVADTGNGAIRLIKDGKVSTLCSMEDGAYPISPSSLLVDGDALYIGDVFSRCLLK